MPCDIVHSIPTTVQQRHGADALQRATHAWHSGGHASRARQNAALTSFAAWFGNALRAAEPGCFTCRGGPQAFGSPSPAQVSAALATNQENICVTRDRDGQVPRLSVHEIGTARCPGKDRPRFDATCHPLYKRSVPSAEPPRGGAGNARRSCDRLAPSAGRRLAHRSCTTGTGRTDPRALVSAVYQILQRS